MVVGKDVLASHGPGGGEPSEMPSLCRPAVTPYGIIPTVRVEGSQVHGLWVLRANAGLAPQGYEVAVY